MIDDLVEKSSVREKKATTAADSIECDLSGEQSHPDKEPPQDIGLQEDMFIIEPFPTHMVENSNHMRNFIRYLFSMSKNHPKNHDTKRNFVVEGGDLLEDETYWKAQFALGMH